MGDIMLKLSKFTDYGIVLLSYFAHNAEKQPFSAKYLSVKSCIPLPTVSKLLKMLTNTGLLNSEIGRNGGYSLVKRPHEISVGLVISLLEGPLALTECSDEHGQCKIEADCPVRNNWRKINRVVKNAMELLTIEDMSSPMPAHLLKVERSASAARSPVRL